MADGLQTFCQTSLLDATPAILLVVGMNGQVLAANRAACQAYGYDRATLSTLYITDLQADPDGTRYAMANLPLDRTFETVHRRCNGLELPVEVRAGAIRHLEQWVQLWVIEDITPRRRDRAVKALLHEIDKGILQQQPLDLILQHMCSTLAALLDVELVLVSQKEADGSLAVLAQAGRGAAFLKDIVLRWDDGPYADGPSGTAVRTATAQTVEMNRAGGPEQWRQRMAEFGMMAAVAVPLVVRNTVLGTLGLYSAKPCAFRGEAMNQLMGIADQVALSLAAARDQEEIRLQRVALEAAANSVVITDSNGYIKWVNPAFCSLTGYDPAEVIGKNPRLLKSGCHSESYYAELWETILAGRTWKGDLLNRRKDGSVYLDEQTITPVQNADGEITHFICIKQDVTERKRQEEQLRYLASHDPVTDLLNRRGLGESLQKALEQSQSGRGGALLLLDLDNFKVVNDTLGHAAGDELLVQLSQVFRSAVRPGDTLARLGGDEFAVLLDGCSLTEAGNVAERLHQRVVNSRVEVRGRTFELSLSIGIAPIDGRLDAGSVIALADAAMYSAKDSGKNRTVTFEREEQRGTDLAAAAHWAEVIRNALREDRFVLHFQPVVQLESNQSRHVEALLRLRAPDGALIGPSIFVPAAERFSLMPAVDRWVLQQVLDLAESNAVPAVFVNISGQSLGDPALLELLSRRLQGGRIKPGRLTLEVTETAAVRDLNLARRWMKQAKALGCAFALDDFGTGFATFASLRALPVDYVKVDGSFVHNMDRDETNLALVQGMVAAAHSLGKTVIAEWVENSETLAHLRNMGVAMAQGVFLGRPAALTPAQPVRSEGA